MKEDYFLNKTANWGVGEESLIRLVHECGEHRYYYIKESRRIEWVRGKSRLYKGIEEFRVVDVFVLQDDLPHPSEMNYLWDVHFCSWCGYKFVEADK